MRESDVKYLAGLYDADGSATFQFNNNGRGYLVLQIAASDAVSRNHEILYWLQDTFGGRVQHHADLKTSTVKSWKLSKANDLHKVVPILLKHLVIKGNTLAAQYDIWKNVLQGKKLSDVEISYWKNYNKNIRQLFNGPVKPKSHPTWAWVAGYLDGDGCFTNRYCSKHKSYRMRVHATGHEKDLVGMKLLYKAFGGQLYEKKTEPGIWVWARNLGPKDRSFAVRFLKKLVRHSKIKKYKIEKILANHSQRLSVEDPTG